MTTHTCTYVHAYIHIHIYICIYTFTKEPVNDEHKKSNGATTASAAVGQQQGVAKLRILVVEDHLVNQKVAVAMVGFGILYRVYVCACVCVIVCVHKNSSR